MRYLFTSERLGFRDWKEEDIPVLAALNADPVVMEFFPSIQDYQQTVAFVDKMQSQFAANGYCYFAVDRLDREECIGFIGLTDQVYKADFTPCVDIGWRLKQSAWHNGFAKEGASRCLEYGLKDLRLSKIYAVAPKINTRSEHIMKSIGMHKVSEFDHPALLEDKRLNPCILYLKEG
jgi:RimJ/RimL family protein N-acetyltransferase